MAEVDAHDLPLSTSSAQAAESYRAGVALMLSGWPGAAENLDAAAAADPDFALAHAARARLHATRAEAAAARACIARASEAAALRADERERSHVETLALAVGGRVRAALDAALAHVERWPRDAIVFSLPLGAFGLFAFSGMADHDQARVDLCERHAAAYAPDDWWFLAYRGWSLVENGAAGPGRALLERSYAARRANANAVHALAHAMFEAGAGAEAQALIDDWLPDYDRSGVLHGHIAWHAALVALEDGDAEAALALYGAHVRPQASQGVPINIVSDGASFLWRMDLYGHAAPAARWREIADYAEQAFPKPGHSFLDPHLALIEAATGDHAALDRRLAALEALDAQGGLAAGPVVAAIVRAARAFGVGDYARCAQTLEPFAGDVVRIGGSGAQREVIEDTLLVALMRSGETGKARALLDRRLHRRPSSRDSRWRASLTA